MDTYPVDLDAGQIVRWLLDQQRAGRRMLQFNASRSYLVESIPLVQQQRRRLGDEEMEDLTEVTAVGVLEIASLRQAEGWVLRIRVEDVLGQRIPDDIQELQDAQDIEISEFYNAFILPGTGTAYVSAEAESPQAWAMCQKLLGSIQANIHET